ncbi:hypothetical protein RB614_19730 [Phytohabitans sp. ZYX-F-186]|uniref:Uncharacterized protein n=1 Tax=Phytohabitans maris TaxID=3071409 RepID=A0ABU0ZI66_9ACTN|nr:hypothetical protein [Phytohabitans sp. ZYX-F-186]MDQ7906750.1 hypothetical protein [Phytohabitans sp. ZYX-F-186]
MSKRPRLDPIAAARIKRAARCPDCSSTVTLAADQTSYSVAHDDDCPTLAALRRQGRTTQIAMARGTNQTAEDFATATLNVVQLAAAHRDQLWPGSTGLRLSLGHGYTDLHVGDGR